MVLIRFGSDADPTCMQMDEVSSRDMLHQLMHLHRHASEQIEFKQLLPHLTYAYRRYLLPCASASPVRLSAAQVLASTSDVMKNFAVIYLVCPDLLSALQPPVLCHSAVMVPQTRDPMPHEQA